MAVAAKAEAADVGVGPDPLDPRDLLHLRRRLHIAGCCHGCSGRQERAALGMMMIPLTPRAARADLFP